jgi:Hemerythrin HHE cation binding domain
MTTGIDLVMLEHRRMEDLFAAFRDAPDGVAAGCIFDALAAHDDGEQAALYPLLEALGVAPDVVQRSREAHSRVKRLIDHARAQEGPPLVEAMVALEAAVTDHVAEEEQSLLPSLQNAATDAQLQGLAARWQQVQQRVG